MSKIPTAEEFIKQYFDSKHPGLSSIRTATGIPVDEVRIIMIEYAKLHVKPALEAAAEVASNSDLNVGQIQNILNAYPLNLNL